MDEIILELTNNEVLLSEGLIGKVKSAVKSAIEAIRNAIAKAIIWLTGIIAKIVEIVGEFIVKVVEKISTGKSGFHEYSVLDIESLKEIEEDNKEKISELEGYISLRDEDSKVISLNVSNTAHHKNYYIRYEGITGDKIKEYLTKFRSFVNVYKKNIISRLKEIDKKLENLLHDSSEKDNHHNIDLIKRGTITLLDTNNKFVKELYNFSANLVKQVKTKQSDTHVRLTTSTYDDYNNKMDDISAERKAKANIGKIFKHVHEGGMPPMTFKNNLTLLSEAAAIDLKMDTEEALRYETVKEAYDAIPEMDEDVVTEASDVVVLNTKNGEYYTEFVNLAPFMKDAGITDIAEALDLVAAANGLNPKDVGLVIESQADVDSYLEAAKKKSDDTRNSKAVKNAMNKVSKSTSTSKALMDKGYKVKKKSKDSKVCPKCGKAASKCKCECGDMSSGAASPAVPKHGNISEAFENMDYDTYTAVQERLTDTLNNIISEQTILNEEGVLDSAQDIIKGIGEAIAKAFKIICAKLSALWEWIKTQCRKIKNKILAVKDKITKVTVELYGDPVKAFIDKVKTTADQMPGLVEDIIDKISKDDMSVSADRTRFAADAVEKDFSDVAGQSLADIIGKKGDTITKQLDEIADDKFKKETKTLTAQDIIKELDRLEKYSNDIAPFSKNMQALGAKLGQTVLNKTRKLSAMDGKKALFTVVKTTVLAHIRAVSHAVGIIDRCIKSDLAALAQAGPYRKDDYYEDNGYQHRNSAESTGGKGTDEKK